MKANEAPEKIHIQPKAHDRWFEGNIPNGLPDGLFVEYVRKDTFIEKSCKLLVNCIEDFMARRMEIWNEECKKQTLENLRKALKE